MTEKALEAIRLMPRHELEVIATRAVLQIRRDRYEIEASNTVLSGLIGFLLGAIVAASGLLLGLGLG
jgi:hypothetical protein